MRHLRTHLCGQGLFSRADSWCVGVRGVNLGAAIAGYSDWTCRMSRSRRSQPVTGVTLAVSEKEWKRQGNRRLRQAAARILQQVPAGDADAVVLPVLDEVANPYDSPKEGKSRFDPREWPKMMRK